MAERLIKWAHGIICVRISEGNTDRFLNLVKNREVHIFKIKRNNDSLEMYMYAGDIRKIKDCVKKAGVKIRVIERYGLPFVAYRHRKRKSFIFGMVTAFIIIYILSLYVWDIRIEGNYSYTGYEITKLLRANDIYCGMKKEDIDCDGIEKLIRNTYSDVTWVSAEVLGTRIVVHIKENFMLGENEEIAVQEDKGYRIVAKEAGTIESIVTRSGTPLVKAGDTVEEGQVLIEGAYEIMSDFDEYIRTQYVKADGDIYAYVSYDYCEEINRSYIKREYTGNEYSFTRVRGNNSSGDFSINKPEFELYEEVVNEKQLRLGENFYIPVYVSDIVWKEYVVKEVEYTDAELQSLLMIKENYFLENLSKKGIQIIENNVKIDVSANKATASGNILVLKSLGSLEEIPADEINLEEENE